MFIGDLLLLLWMWGLSLSVWERHGIDFVKLLDLENTEFANIRDPAGVVYHSAADLTLWFFVSFITFNKVERGVLNLQGSQPFARAIPIFLLAYLIYRALLPFKTRMRWWTMLGRVLTAPCHNVIFRDGYIGDLLTSLVRVCVSILFSVVYILLVGYAIFFDDES
jgi:hypothetical protein